MPLSIDELRRKVEEYHNKGLNSQQIADELSLSQTTIQWLSSSNLPMDEDTPSDIMVGWRSVAVKAARVEAVSYVFCDIIDEEIGEEVDTMVGISINGIPFAQAIAGQMDLELAVSRTISESESGHLSEVFANVSGKRVVVIDDVVSSGRKGYTRRSGSIESTMKMYLEFNPASRQALCIISADRISLM